MPKGIPKNGINKGWLKKGHKKYKYPKNGNSSWYKNGYEGLSEEKSPTWLGDKVGYCGVHDWVTKWKGTPKECEMCGTLKAKKYEWANVDHKYRRVLEDFIRMCTRCHRNYDYQYNKK